MSQNSSSSTTRTALLTIGAVLTVLVVGGGVFALDIKNHQWKLWDEWECSQGEVPILRTHGGGEVCLKEGARIPRGWRLDPLGNRPFDCTDRDGWVFIEPFPSRNDAALSCYPDGKALPEGWRLAAS